ncbi:hypothetical protein FNV43_RR14399 [Rhamnella rubrinervis]|uniref:Uncharacterized protein n=1 Tax=Rhamnella rubrinervis TaxID=2594499 RepID=A0A8K0H2S2_9ROSA|nr:hypothetical protein FNV43_RR14399 [Rhamnella rubrinervis]
MGLFSLAVGGGGFILIGACEALTFSTRNSYPNQVSDPSSPLTSIQTSLPSSTSSFKAKPSYAFGLSFIFISLLSSLFVLNSLISLLDAVNASDSVGSALQLQVVAISSLFLLYAILGFLVNFTNRFPLPSSIITLIGLFAFVEEFLLFYLQKKDPEGLENRYFDLMLVPVAICVFSTVLELKSPKSNYPKLARGVGLILQGMWFLQMGFSFYTNLLAHGCSLHEKNKGNYTVKCKGHPEYHRAKAIATLQFNCHLALLVVLVTGIYSIIARAKGIDSELMRYKPLAEMQHIDNQNQFTLDSDDELSEGVKEEDSVQKAGVVELTVNGHGSH